MTLQTGALVLYKHGPARVAALGDKIEIALPKGKSKRVRPKDIQLLHPGPAGALDALGPLDGDISTARELLADDPAPLAELAELAFGRFDPQTAWAAWLLLDDDLHFDGGIQAIRGRNADKVQTLMRERQAKAAEADAWQATLARIGGGEYAPEDERFLAEVATVAEGQSKSARLLKALDIAAKPDLAHALLLRVGYWQDTHNPYPRRAALAGDDPDLAVGALPDEPRRDLSALAAYAIDDVGSDDPDDAVSIDGDRIWVHIADVAALVPPDSPLDLIARDRVANQYLPERIVHMLPPELTRQLGLGLAARSPALSIGFRLDDNATPADTQILISTVAVERLSYAEADDCLDSTPTLAALWAQAERYQQRRFTDGAQRLNLPEVRVRVRDNGDIRIEPLPQRRSRDLVTELMLMAGEAVARWGEAQGIALPYVAQPPPETIETATDEGMAAMFQRRRGFQKSRLVSRPDRHSGLGLEPYTRATSPLRRYSDLVVHQQIRAVLSGNTPLDHDAMLERLAAIDLLAGPIVRSERLSNQHWKLLWLQRQSDWQSEGIVVDQQDRRGTLMIPELALEVKMRGIEKLNLNDTVPVSVGRIDLPDLHVTLHRR